MSFSCINILVHRKLPRFAREGAHPCTLPLVLSLPPPLERNEQTPMRPLIGAFPLAVVCPCRSNLGGTVLHAFIAFMCVFTSNIPFSPEPLSFVHVDVEAVDLDKDIRISVFWTREMCNTCQ